MPDKITAIEQKTVLIYDDELIAIRGEDNQIYVSVRHLCSSLELERKSQVRRIRRSDVLVEGFKGGGHHAPPSSDNRGGGKQQAQFLRADLVPLWVSGIDTSRVKDEIKPKIVAFQKEAGKVLWEAF